MMQAMKAITTARTSITTKKSQKGRGPKDKVN